MKKSHVNGIRWFARILGSLILLLVLLMVIGEVLLMEPPSGSTGKLGETDIPFMTGMIVMLVGIVVAWFLVIFPVIGLLHLFCWWQSRKLKPKKA